MKERINKLKTFVVALTLLAAFSCAGLDDDMDSPSVNTTADVTSMQESIRWANAIVTVRTASSGRSYFQLSDDSTLDPLGWQNPFSKEVRALVAYSELTDKSDFCTRSVKVERIDSIVTRDAAYISVESDLKDGSPYPVFSVPVGYKTTSEMLNASSPLEIVSDDGRTDWMTFSEDGYLMIHFATFWGEVTQHTVNLYALQDHPDHLYIVHKDNGDLQSTWKEGLVAFKICHLYPFRKDGYNNPESIVLHWMSFNGEKSVVLKYGKRAVER